MVKFSKNSLVKYLTIIFTLLLTLTFNAQGQPEDALDFDGTDDYVKVNHDFSLELQDDFTISFWVYTRDVTNYRTILSKGNANTGTDINYGIQYKSGSIATMRFFTYDTADGGYSVYDFSGAGKKNQWAHYAFVMNNGVLTLYVNGEEHSGSPKNVSADIPLTTDGQHPLFLGLHKHVTLGSSQYLDGKLDEVRIWTSVRSKSQIRDFMCEGLNLPKPNLEAYWKLNDGSGTTATDKASSNKGNLKNGPNWVTSGIPLGDSSKYVYSNPSSLSWKGTGGPNEKFTINNISGANGAHLVHVKNPPSNTSSSLNELSKRNYFIVNTIGGGTYDVEYLYTDHVGWSNSSEGDLTLASRNNNASGSWNQKSPTQDISNNKLTLTGQTGTEYILGSTTSLNKLPVELIYFNAEKNGSDAQLSWGTASETNNSHFLIQKRTNEKWNNIGKVEGNGTSTKPNKYTFLHENPDKGANYYRLKQVDFNGSFEFSDLRSVSFQGGYEFNQTKIELIENPVGKKIRLVVTTEVNQQISFQLINGQGKQMRQVRKQLTKGRQNLSLNVHDLQKGNYFLRIKTQDRVVTKQLIK